MKKHTILYLPSFFFTTHTGTTTNTWTTSFILAFTFLRWGSSFFSCSSNLIGSSCFIVDYFFLFCCSNGGFIGISGCGFIRGTSLTIFFNTTPFIIFITPFTITISENNFTSFTTWITLNYNNVNLIKNIDINNNYIIYNFNLLYIKLKYCYYTKYYINMIKINKTILSH